jgi:cobalt-zinc-cadmium efflux system membrane fusion protein
MIDRTRVVKLRWPLAAAAAAGLLAAGAGVSWLLLDRGRQHAVAVPSEAPMPMAPPPAATAPDGATVTVTIPQDVAARAGLEVATVSTAPDAGNVTVPAVVEPHGYKEVMVTPLAGGRITRVLVELGQQVVRGQSMAEIYSPELASAQTQYLSARASLDAARQRLNRTDRLVEIGAASRQEYEEARAEEARLATEVESARSRLTLLGMSAARIQQLAVARQMTSTISVPAPIAGVVTTREANTGQNVDPSTTLFTVVDLSTVWVVGDVYERDFGKIRVGTSATVTTDAFAGLALTGKVSYIDPRVDEQTRTAKVRVEVANRDRALRLGMYVSLTLSAAGSRSALTVPAAAVQTIGDRTVVYVVDPGQQGRFIERQVTVGSRVDDKVQVLAGLSPGDVVVAQGSFFIRAERERVNPSGAASSAPTAAAPSSTAVGEIQTTGVIVQITERGFEPPRVTVPRGEQASITFVRRTDNTCAKELVIASQGIRRELPLNQPVTVAINASSSGEVAFVCGMNMLKGVIVVQ